VSTAAVGVEVALLCPLLTNWSHLPPLFKRFPKKDFAACVRVCLPWTELTPEASSHNSPEESPLRAPPVHPRGCMTHASGYSRSRARQPACGMRPNVDGGGQNARDANFGRRLTPLSSGYFQGKLDDERKFYEGQLASSEEAFKGLEIKMKEYEELLMTPPSSGAAPSPESASDRLATIAETASLEGQVADLEEEAKDLRSQLSSAQEQKYALQREWETAEADWKREADERLKEVQADVERERKRAEELEAKMAKGRKKSHEDESSRKSVNYFQPSRREIN